MHADPCNSVHNNGCSTHDSCSVLELKGDIVHAQHVIGNLGLRNLFWIYHKWQQSFKI